MKRSNPIITALTGKYSGAVVLLNSALIAIAAASVGLMWFFHTEQTTPMESQLFAGTTVLLALCLTLTLFVIYPVVRVTTMERFQIGQRAESLEKQATTDPLTGMHNRRYFEEALKGYLAEFNRIGASLGLLILDLDHFKSVNDNYGHDVGDIVLKEVALRMRAISREHDIVARLGGEEFAVITPYASFEQLRSVAERYRQMVEALKIKNGNVIIRPTVSIGVATNEGRVDNADDLYKAADKKLYQAKNAGRNRVAA